MLHHLVIDMTTATDIVGGSWPRRKKSYCEEREKEDTGTQFSAVRKLSKSILKRCHLSKKVTQTCPKQSSLF